MTKYVINTVEVIKKVYIADTYSEKEALDRYLDQAPDKVEFIGELVYSIETINEYEYDKEWKRPNRSLDFLDPDIGPDQLKDGLPDQRELFELELELADIGRD